MRLPKAGTRTGGWPLLLSSSDILLGRSTGLVLATDATERDALSFTEVGLGTGSATVACFATND